MRSKTTTAIEGPPDTPGGDSPGRELLVMSPDAFATVPLPRAGVVTIGRATSCLVQLDDPACSREHARLHLDETLGIEDLRSANGTRVRDQVITPGEVVPISLGEAVRIGSTVLMAQRIRSATGPTRLSSHAYFEARLDVECDRARDAGEGFALARLQLEHSVPWTALAPLIARSLGGYHALAAYGPRDYELLFACKGGEDARARIEALRQALAQAGYAATAGLATYPSDGRTGDALMARANEALRSASGRPVTANASGELESAHPEMRRLYELARRAAASSINVLVLGETGVGKDVLSRFIHASSPRARKPLLSLNCAAFTESLIESELFGHEKGAFTGAIASKPGLLESADGGTVFLDEVGELAPAVQARLLRVIETREVLRVGALRSRQIDVRFIAATNRSLEQEVLSGHFRRDLFYRLNGLTLTVPALRERGSDIMPLATHFLSVAARFAGRATAPLISEEASSLLEAYEWPGNVRELKNVMERALVICEGDIVLPEHLPLEKMIPERVVSPVGAPSTTDTSERERIIEALNACAWNQTRAAAMLGISRRTFVARLEQYKVPRPQKTRHAGD